MAPVNDGLMTIGAFSWASLLSIKALRAYHEAGILVPARVDPGTGYRSYHAGQLPDVRDPPAAGPGPAPRPGAGGGPARDPEVTGRILAEHAPPCRPGWTR